MLIDFEEGKKVGFRMEMVEKDSDEGKKNWFWDEKDFEEGKKKIRFGMKMAKKDGVVGEEEGIFN